MANKVVVVLGATGTQGSSVIRALLAHGGYTIRAITRSPTSPASIALSGQGVQLAQATLTDKPSLIRAFEGAYAVFGLTPVFPAEDEEELGRNLVDATKAVGVKLLIWSSLPSVREMTGGKYTLEYWDKKAAVDAYLRASGQPGIALHTGHFAENTTNYRFLHRDPTSPNPEGWKLTASVRTSNVSMPGIWIGADLGNLVVAVIDKWEDGSIREKLQREPLVGAFYRFTIDELVETIERVTGKKVTHTPRPVLPAWQQTVDSFLRDGLWNYPDQTSLLQDLGMWGKTHTLEDYVREVVVPYMKLPVEETVLTREADLAEVGPQE